MDVESLTQAVTGLKVVIDLAKQAKGLLPEGPQRESVAAKLEQAERQLRVAEGEIASNLDYELCRKHFPPEIMLSADDFVWECSKCGNTKDRSPSGEIVTLDHNLYKSRRR